MVVCPVCNKDNGDEEYCADCGTKLRDIKENSVFEFHENKDISNVNELNRYLKELNEKINMQKKFLDELNNDPLINRYETISKINDENNKLRKEIEKLNHDNEKISSDLKQLRKRNSQLQSEINNLKGESNVFGVINGIFGSNKGDVNFCPNCGYKLH